MLAEMLKEYDVKMQKTIEVVKSDFGSVRAGRANAAVLDKIVVEYYGSPTPLNQVAAISSPDPRMLQIQPWDGSLLKAIEKAIQTSDLGINPQNDGRVIRLTFPQLTEERRKDLAKQVNKYGEGGKVAIRNIRRDAIDKIKAMQKKSEITEDDAKDYEKKMQDLTDKHCKEIDELTARNASDEWLFPPRALLSCYSITKKRRYPFGCVDISLEMNGLTIADIHIGGDFFGREPISVLEDLLRHSTKREVEEKLSTCCVEDYIFGMTRRELIEQIFS